MIHLSFNPSVGYGATTGLFTDRRLDGRNTLMPLRWLGMYGMGYRRDKGGIPYYVAFDDHDVMAVYFTDANRRPAVRTYLWPLLLLHALNTPRYRAFTLRWIEASP